MIFFQATPIKSSNQTIATMISLLGLLTITSPAMAMDLPDTGNKVADQKIIESIKEEAPKNNKRDHHRVASGVEGVNKAIDIKVEPKRKKSDLTKEVLETALKEDAPVVTPIPVPDVDIKYLTTLRTELMGFMGVVKTDCVSCLGTATTAIPRATQDVINLLTEIIAAGDTLLSEVGPIVQLFHAIQDINTSANPPPLKSAQPVLTKDQKKANKKAVQSRQEMTLRNLNHLSKDARTALLHHQNLAKNAPVVNVDFKKSDK